jgi:hypothetical protein
MEKEMRGDREQRSARGGHVDLDQAERADELGGPVEWSRPLPMVISTKASRLSDRALVDRARRRRRRPRRTTAYFHGASRRIASAAAAGS